MKRCRIGAVLLLLLLTSSVFAGNAMEQIHEPIARALELAADAARQNNWDAAAALSQEAEAEWNRRGIFRACFADHTPIEDVESDLAQLEIYREAQEDPDFSAICMELARKVRAMGQAHSLNLGNVM